MTGFQWGLYCSAREQLVSSCHDIQRSWLRVQAKAQHQLVQSKLHGILIVGSICRWVSMYSLDAITISSAWWQSAVCLKIYWWRSTPTHLSIQVRIKLSEPNLVRRHKLSKKSVSNCPLQARPALQGHDLPSAHDHNFLEMHDHECFVSSGGDVRELDFQFNVGDKKIGAPFHGLKAFFTTPQLSLLDKVSAFSSGSYLCMLDMLKKGQLTKLLSGCHMCSAKFILIFSWANLMGDEPESLRRESYPPPFSSLTGQLQQAMSCDHGEKPSKFTSQ